VSKTICPRDIWLKNNKKRLVNCCVVDPSQSCIDQVSLDQMKESVVSTNHLFGKMVFDQKTWNRFKVDMGKISILLKSNDKFKQNIKTARNPRKFGSCRWWPIL
jgi:hypothetical protein